jgi:hypothetical protein
MSWDWINKKGTNYYTRLRLIGRVNKFVRANYEFNKPVQLKTPVVFTYSGGKVLITAIELVQYYHEGYKQTKTYVRICLDNGNEVHLEKLRLKHLFELIKEVSD